MPGMLLHKEGEEVSIKFTSHEREMQLQDTWSRDDRDPVIHKFSAKAGL